MWELHRRYNSGDFKDAITVGAVNDNNEWACFSSGQDFGSYIKA